ncbi:MAG: hypothetical protein PHD36_03575 [Desulfotomaculaceae bacterium]|nr:hypothetical protein [Desulfotomaculaceae bacterium]
MWEAVFGDVGVALIAIFNAMRVMNTESMDRRHIAARELGANPVA